MLRTITYLVVLTSLLVSGCTSPQKRAQMENFQSWRAHAHAEAQSGRLKWSAYYAELWSKFNAFPPDPQKNIIQSITAELIPIARKYEAGEISAAQFQDAQRIAASKVNRDMTKQQQYQQAINDAQAERLYRIGNKATQPTNPRMNCITNRIGPDVLSTNCN